MAPHDPKDFEIDLSRQAAFEAEEDLRLREWLGAQGLRSSYEKNEKIVHEFERQLRVMFTGNAEESFAAARIVSRTSLDAAFALNVVRRTRQFAAERMPTRLERIALEETG